MKYLAVLLIFSLFKVILFYAYGHHLSPLKYVTSDLRIGGGGPRTAA